MEATNICVPNQIPARIAWKNWKKMGQRELLGFGDGNAEAGPSLVNAATSASIGIQAGAQAVITYVDILHHNTHE